MHTIYRYTEQYMVLSRLVFIETEEIMISIQFYIQHFNIGRSEITILQQIKYLVYQINGNKKYSSSGY